MNWRWWSRRAEQWREELREEAREHIGDSAHWRKLAIAASIFVAALVALGVYWSGEPEPFDIRLQAREMLSDAEPARGALTTATLVHIVTTLLDKRGGFINNDRIPPGVWLDNMPAWERGALQQARDLLRSLRDDFGAGAQTPDEDLARAEPRLNFSADSWMLPSSESKYADARDFLRDYLVRLQRGDESVARFVADAETLDQYLARVTARLDVLVQQLSASVPHDDPLRPEVRAGTAELTPAARIDDIFFEARGSSWVLLHVLRAIDGDFADVLRDRNAQRELRRAIAALDAAQGAIYSPLILNGSGFGLVANHSLVMASYMARAHAAVANVRRLLAETAAPAIPAGENRGRDSIFEKLFEIEKTTNEQEANP